MLFLAVFDSGDIENIVADKRCVRIVDSLLDKVSRKAPHEAQKPGDTFALGMEMLGDLGVGAGRIRFKIIAVLDGLG
ncbi:MAG: hypothetical protein A2787_04525 [Omnitrophica WOR_2 bacterium RIFCSPHIGHO2_01_FULL_48_9]|nr:MAG: hypothetical protein A2787_04525 [Omnitrophica WOR_2 bacterium RIFCSPHIGHO2_01_FULL_48_9]